MGLADKTDLVDSRPGRPGHTSRLHHIRRRAVSISPNVRGGARLGPYATPHGCGLGSCLYGEQAGGDPGRDRLSKSKQC